jgi:hypothetical protein
MKTIIKEAVPGTYNLKHLAGLYGVCTKTMKKQIDLIADQLGDRTGRRLYSVREVEIIFKYYGVPKMQVMIREADELRKAA